MRPSLLSLLLLVLLVPSLPGQRDPFVLRDGIVVPELPRFVPLPEADPGLTELLRLIVEATSLDEVTPAEASPERVDERSSIFLVDLRDPANPRVAGWNEDHLVYPASTYKMYVAAEAIRTVVAGERSLDDIIVVSPHNVRSSNDPQGGAEVTLSEALRLTMQYSSNTMANELIDLVDRQKASALMHALGCEGSEITRKFLPRDREDEGYDNIVGTATSARHLGTFLWAMETGAIGDGKGRGLMKGYLAMNDRGRFYRGLPESATVHSKTGWWNIYTSEGALIEDGEVSYILCALTVYPTATADERMADLARRVHAMMSGTQE